MRKQGNKMETRDNVYHVWFVIKTRQPKFEKELNKPLV